MKYPYRLWLALGIFVGATACASQTFDPPPVPAPIEDPRPTPQPTPQPDPAPVTDPLEVEWPEIGKLARGLNYAEVVAILGAQPSKPLRKVAREPGMEAASWRRQVGEELFFAHLRFLTGRLESWVVR